MTALTLAEIRNGTGFPADARFVQVTDYNGWTNYATWGVALVLSNDHGVYNETREQAAAFKSSAPDQPQVADGTWTAEQAAKFGLEDWLKDYTEQLCGLERDDDALSRISPSMMAHQVISAGLADVDWGEIAANILSELPERVSDTAGDLDEWDASGRDCDGQPRQ